MKWFDGYIVIGGDQVRTKNVWPDSAKLLDEIELVFFIGFVVY